MGSESYPAALFDHWRHTVWSWAGVLSLIIGSTVVSMTGWPVWSLAGLLLASLAWAQYRTWADMRDERNAVAVERDGFAQQLDTSQRAASLTECLIEAQQLDRRPVTTDDQLEAWRQDFEAWYQRTYSAISEALSPAEAVIFSDRSRQLAMSVSGSYNGKHSDWRATMHYFMGNLRSIIERRS